MSLLLSLVAAVAVLGCELVPGKPDAVFILYRDRMKAEKFDEARELLLDTSKNLALQLISEYHLKRPPENLALLNVLDPVSPPIVVKAEDTFALLQLRGLKGGSRIIRVVRKNSGAPWKIDITDELQALRKFLGARLALDTMREQAGEYASSWKAFTTQLGRMHVKEKEAETQTSGVGPPEGEKAKPEATDDKGRRHAPSQNRNDARRHRQRP